MRLRSKLMEPIASSSVGCRGTRSECWVFSMACMSLGIWSDFALVSELE
jgi:hypothetical protein